MPQVYKECTQLINKKTQGTQQIQQIIGKGFKTFFQRHTDVPWFNLQLIRKNKNKYCQCNIKKGKFRGWNGCTLGKVAGHAGRTDPGSILGVPYGFQSQLRVITECSNHLNKTQNKKGGRTCHTIRGYVNWHLLYDKW